MPERLKPRLSDCMDAMRTLLSLLVRRRLARFMPGGWVAWVLASPTTWRLVRRAYRAIREGAARRRGAGAPGPPPTA
jgi:hypothetical protein